MSQRRRNRIGRLLDVMSTQVERARQAHSRSLDETATSIARAEQLEGFEKEYVEQFTNNGQKGLSAFELEQYATFIENLRGARVSLQRQIEALQERSNQLASELLTQKLREQGIRKTLEKLDARLLRVLSRRDLVEQDDQVNRIELGRQQGSQSNDNDEERN